jgi:hypothetical protein
MNLSRRYQSQPPYAYCTACIWQDTGNNQLVKVEQQAREHADDTGHETRAGVTREVIFRPQSVEVPS